MIDVIRIHVNQLSRRDRGVDHALLVVSSRIFEYPNNLVGDPVEFQKLAQGLLCLEQVLFNEPAYYRDPGLVLDVFFILVAVPESLPEKCRSTSKGLTLEQVDPFAGLRKIWKDKTILMLCVTVFLSYLPEAGQFSCFFVYLLLVRSV